MIRRSLALTAVLLVTGCATGQPATTSPPTPSATTAPTTRTPRAVTPTAARTTVGSREVPAPAASAPEECLAAMRAVAVGGDVSPTDPAMTATLTACEDVPQWLRAVTDNPRAFGLAPGTSVGLIEVQIACPQENRDMAVCADAAQRGLLAYT